MSSWKGCWPTWTRNYNLIMKDSLNNLYARIRAEERAALERRVDDAFARSPQLRELDEARKKLFFDVGSRAITPAEGMEQLSAIAQHEAELLNSLGLPADTLTLHYRCEACQDTGYIGSAPKRPCACRLQYQQEQSGNGDINREETFANFSETVYLDDQQKKRTCKAKIICQRYAESLPHPEQPNLLLTGMPGLGKSYLGNAIAYEAISNGIETARVTAYRFVQDMLSDIRSRNSNHADRYCSISLLVLDDLGSEPDVPNVSVEWLFAIINERALQKLPTVCITNLTLKQLQERYGERLMSRLCDQATTLVLALTGDNLRTAVRQKA